MSDFPFQPAINDNSRAAVAVAERRPILRERGLLLRKKQEALAARVQVELENPDLTFAPAGERREPRDRARAGGGIGRRAVGRRAARGRRAAGQRGVSPSIVGAQASEQRAAKATTRRLGTSTRSRPS